MNNDFHFPTTPNIAPRGPERAFRDVVAQHALSLTSSRKVAFVENKRPDMEAVAVMLEQSAAANHWTNRGPIHDRLASAFAWHVGLPAGLRLLPCANGGIALEALARFHEMQSGRALRWVVSAYSFKNLGRGRFADVIVVDCDDQGLLSLDAVAALDPSTFDGLIVTNPFGLAADFDALFAFARQKNLPLLIDNAAGLSTALPDWPWQAFSLHHTKPYGVGEGGLMLAPESAAETLLSLIEYGPMPHMPGAWIGNGKISDIACAFILDRLGRHADWAPKYLLQRDRVLDLAAQLSFVPLLPGARAVPATSVPLLADREVPREALERLIHFTGAKYYQPLASTPMAESIFRRLVNIPTHPDMAELSDADILDDLARLLA